MDGWIKADSFWLSRQWWADTGRMTRVPSHPWDLPGLPQRPTGSSVGHLETRFLLFGTKYKKMSVLPEGIRIASCLIPLERQRCVLASDCDWRGQRGSGDRMDVSRGRWNVSTCLPSPVAGSCSLWGTGDRNSTLGFPWAWNSSQILWWNKHLLPLYNQCGHLCPLGSVQPSSL